LVDAAYVLRHVVILAGISAGVIREAVPALETILCKFRYGMSVVRDVLANVRQSKDPGMII
jgi:hypothetical protein